MTSRVKFGGLVAAFLVFAACGEPRGALENPGDGGTSGPTGPADLAPGCALPPRVVRCPNPGEACDDNNGCTYADHCQEDGVCRGAESEDCMACCADRDCEGATACNRQTDTLFTFRGCALGACVIATATTNSGCSR